MSLEIVKVSTPADLNRFVSLPWKVYAHSPLWVPNLKSDDRTLLTPGKHLGNSTPRAFSRSPGRGSRGTHRGHR